MAIDTSHWSVADKSKLFGHFLDPTNEDNFKSLKFKKSAMHKASLELFKGTRNTNSVTSMWSRSIKLFKELVAYYSFTGGAGDADADPDESSEARQSQRLAGAKRAGKDVGKLTVKEIKAWEENGWFELFDGRLGSKQNIVRVFDRHSNGELSDGEPTQTVDTQDTQAIVDPEASQNSQDDDVSQPISNWSPSQTRGRSDTRRSISVPLSNWDPSPTRARTRSRTPVHSHNPTFTPSVKPDPDSKPLPALKQSSPTNSVTSASTNLLGKQSEYLQERSEHQRQQLRMLLQKEERESVQNAERLELERQRTQSELEDRRNRMEIERERLRRETEQWEYNKLESQEKRETEKKKYKLEVAEKVVGNMNVNVDVRNAANDYLMTFFRT
ncbi:hypothetical protein C8J56DRAFT_897257 [Mycena floridula]|nr:hypothetical protein C8J56DRAFT_897257 [Mycena floridula]